MSKDNLICILYNKYVVCVCSLCVWPFVSILLVDAKVFWCKIVLQSIKWPDRNCNQIIWLSASDYQSSLAPKLCMVRLLDMKNPIVSFLGGQWLHWNAKDNQIIPLYTLFGAEAQCTQEFELLNYLCWPLFYFRSKDSGASIYNSLSESSQWSVLDFILLVCFIYSLIAFNVLEYLVCKEIHHQFRIPPGDWWYFLDTAH